jgi:hypothetical protein
MSGYLRHLLIAFSVILLLAGCAQIVPLSGGQRDALPPKLREAEPEAGTTHFNTDLITLRFDEFVQLKDLSNQLIVTPRLKTSPDISTEGKKVIVKLKKEELEPNTTYRIFFGNAIADMHESNSLADFEYIFSTGSTLDSLQVKGLVTEAFNNKPAGAVLVGLYLGENVSDSLVYKHEPDYIARTNSEGHFVIRNMPYKSFRAYAFSDENKNYKYDGESEKAAFLDNDLRLESDTSLQLHLFREEPSRTFIKKTQSPYFGLAQIILNKRSLVSLRSLNPAEGNSVTELREGLEKDTVSVCYRDIRDTLSLILHNMSSGSIDTLKLSLPRDNSGRKRLKNYQLNLSGNKLPLYQKPRLSFPVWMDTLRTDAGKIRISCPGDSLAEELPVRGYWKDVTCFELDVPLKEGLGYQLKIDTAAFYDFRGLSNDSARFDFTTQSRTEFGKLSLNMRFHKKQSYVVQLINEQEKVVQQKSLSFSLSSSNSTLLEFSDVPPGVYLTKVIFDDNGNERWDSGNILKTRQPEQVIIHSKQLKILADWEIEEEILIQ